MTSRVQYWLPFLAIILGLSTTAPAGSAHYTVEGIALGERIQQTNPYYRSYSCKRSTTFFNYTWCQWTQSRPTSLGLGALSTTIMHNEDGITLYLMANVEPVRIDRTAAQKEIEGLSAEFNEQPANVEWHSELSGTPASVIAFWGKIELKELSSDDLELVAGGGASRLGVLVDRLGDLVRSAKNYLPIYRISGGAGYIYIASFDKHGRGHRHYVAADMSQALFKQYELQLRQAFKEDTSRPINDYALWSEVARATRNLSLATSPSIANKFLDKIFDDFPSTKLKSHVWSVLPLGSINHLSKNEYSTLDIYGNQTSHPNIRSDIHKFISESPSEPFIEILYYTIGEFDKALQANSKSFLSDVFHYAIGHKTIHSLMTDARRAVAVYATVKSDFDDEDTELFSELNYLVENATLYEGKILKDLVPSFVERAAIAEQHLKIVLNHPSMPHADDAAYLLSWLSYHQGKPKEALSYLSRALAVGNGDYRYPSAIRQIIRISKLYSGAEQIQIVDSEPVFSQQATLWYVAARAAYREFNYPLTIRAGEQALSTLGMPIDLLPATTDPKKIEAAIGKIRPKPRNLYDDYDYEIPNLVEIPYLIEASREMMGYETEIRSAGANSSGAVAKRARAIIRKYSTVLDDTKVIKRRLGAYQPFHRDLRQALHLIEVTFDSVPKSTDSARLREWLHYRKVRLLAQFSPGKVADVITAMEHEFPNSPLLDDVLAEQIYAEGMGIKDVDAARNTFNKLTNKYPRGNAIDNAYTQLAISYHCAGKNEEAQRLNTDIVRLFPLTRHATDARHRMVRPEERSMCID